MTTQPTTTKEALEPCPFCKSNKVENWASRPRNLDHDIWCVFCHDCSCEGPEALTESDAARLWNSRSAPIVAPKQELPSDYICIAPQEQALVINRLRGVGSKEDNRQAELHEKLCLRCQELVAECERREATPIVAPEVDEAAIKRNDYNMEVWRERFDRVTSTAPYSDEQPLRSIIKDANTVIKLLYKEVLSLRAPASPVALVEQSIKDRLNEDRCMFCGGKTAHEPDCDHGVTTPASSSPVALLDEADDLVDEVQHRMDQVVEAAVEWHQAGREGGEWFEAAEKLGAAINSLLELRGDPNNMPRRWCSVHNREEFKYESLEHELHAATTPPSTLAKASRRRD